VEIANPIPAVEPDTTAALPRSPRSISCLRLILRISGPRAPLWCLGDVLRGELEFAGTHHAFGLPGVARTNDGAGGAEIAATAGARGSATSPTTALNAMHLPAIALDQNGFVADVNASADVIFDNNIRIKDMISGQITLIRLLLTSRKWPSRNTAPAETPDDLFPYFLDWAHPDALLIHVDMLAASSSPHELSRKWSVRRNSQGNVDLCASLQDISDEDMSRSRRRGVSPTCQQNCYVLYSIM
jgi:hypothetical protein